MKLNKLLIFTLFLILPLGQLERINAYLYLHDLIILVLIILNFKLIRFSRPLLYFLACALISLILARLPLKDIFLGSLYLLRFTAYACLLPIFKALKPDLKPYLKYLALALAILGLAQYLFLPDTRFLSQLNWDDHYFRLISTVFDPSFLGLILVLGLILFNLKIFPSLILLTALFLTYSRSSYLSLAAVIIAYSLAAKRYIFLLLLLIFSLLFFLPRPGGEGVKLERIFSINQRFDNYQEGIELFKKSPIFGVGFNTLRYYRQDYTSRAAAGLDSSLLFVLATTGLLGFGAFCYWLYSLWRKASLLLKLSLIAILVHSLFQNSFFYPLVLIWFFSVLSLDRQGK